MRGRVERPYLGGLKLAVDMSAPSDSVVPVFSPTIGYVQHVDTGALSELAEEAKGMIHIVALPGAFLDPTRPMAFCDGLDARRRWSPSSRPSPSATSGPSTRIPALA